MDSVFASCLSEIEKSYLVLPKTSRIRVERWVEKLAATGNNPVWKRHRNDYAKLLLTMVSNRTLNAPFNAIPPEGPLPPFSNQFKIPNRNLLGPHETSFWRGLYQQFEGDNATNDTKNSFESEKEDYLASAMKSKLSTSFNIPTATSASCPPLHREIQTQNMLIREQSQRIKLLEQQLQDERTQHELQIQRLNYSHRIEVNKLKSQLDKFAVELAVENISPSRREVRRYIDTSMEENLPFASSPISPKFPMRFAGSPPSRHSPTPRTPQSPVPAVAGSSSRSGLADNYGKRGLLSFMEQKNHITTALNSLDSRDSLDANTAVFDLTPRPKTTTQQQNQSHRQQHYSFSNAISRAVENDNEENSQLNGNYNTNNATAIHQNGTGSGVRGGVQGGVERHSNYDQYTSREDLETPNQYEESRFDDSAVDQSLRWGSNQYYSTGIGNNIIRDSEDEAFLAHIDRFQSEIKKINTNITLTSPERY